MCSSALSLAANTVTGALEYCIGYNNLRHSCASILLANGVSMKEIQEWLRHSSYSTTANIYAHLDVKSKENSANTMNSIFGKERTA